MFKCDRCNKTSDDKETKVVIKTRSKVYSNEVLGDRGKPRFNKATGKKIEKFSDGTEIVKEESVCGRCL